jgi:hypothetical protein
LTDEYVETGRVLCGWVGLGDRVSLHQGSALSMPSPTAPSMAHICCMSA